MKAFAIGFAVVVGTLLGSCILGILNILAIDSSVVAPRWQVIGARVVCGVVYSGFLILWSHALGKWIGRHADGGSKS